MWIIVIRLRGGAAKLQRLKSVSDNRDLELSATFAVAAGPLELNLGATGEVQAWTQGRA